MNKHAILIAIFTLFSITASHAEVVLAGIFTNHTVLQRNSKNLIWGWAEKGEKVDVFFKNQKLSTVANAQGEWQVRMKPEPAGGPYTLTVRGKNEIVLNDILVGEVWICSGQSNMDYTLAGIRNDEVIKNANNPAIRQITIPHVTSFSPLNNTENPDWQLCTPQTAGSFSAAGYFFAEKLYNELHIPIGLIKAAWGGTNIETWISNSSIGTHPDFKDEITNNPSIIRNQIQKQIEKKLKVVYEFQRGDVNAVDVKEWKNENYDDSRWQSIYAPLYWEEQGLNPFDGVVWYRKEINLTREQADNADKIVLSKIDDRDDSYINGKFIGRTFDYRLVREYDLPEKTLKPGRNLIAIRVEDGSVGGGIYGEEDMYIRFKNGLPPFPLNGDWRVRVDTTGIAKTVLRPNAYPSQLYNAMINPIRNFGAKGVIWYQGEANAWRAKQYESLFPMLIKDWRKQLNNKKLPFYYVQLASYNATDSNSVNGSAWAELRDAQRKTLSLPHTGMVVATDIGDAKDIHPTDKKSVGERLALHALKNDYGKKVVSSGPLYKSIKCKNGKAYITFSSVGSGLTIRTGESELDGFLLAGADRKFHKAQARIVGKQVVVSSENVPNPVAVRYAWTDVNEHANLYNKEGLPASPFRTDSWAGITDKNKYVIAE